MIINFINSFLILKIFAFSCYQELPYPLSTVEEIKMAYISLQNKLNAKEIINYENNNKKNINSKCSSFFICISSCKKNKKSVLQNNNHENYINYINNSNINSNLDTKETENSYLEIKDHEIHNPETNYYDYISFEESSDSDGVVNAISDNNTKNCSKNKKETFRDYNKILIEEIEQDPTLPRQGRSYNSSVPKKSKSSDNLIKESEEITAKKQIDQIENKIEKYLNIISRIPSKNLESMQKESLLKQYYYMIKICRGNLKNLHKTYGIENFLDKKPIETVLSCVKETSFPYDTPFSFYDSFNYLKNYVNKVLVVFGWR